MQNYGTLRAVCAFFILTIVIFSLAIEFGANLDNDGLVVDSLNILSYYKEYQQKMIEEKIDDYIYEDDDESEEYEDEYEDFLKMKEKFSDALNLGPSFLEHDEEWQKINTVMKNRVKYMKRTCGVRRKIQNLVDREDFDGLLALHRQIYDLEGPAPQEDRQPIQCNSPSFSKKYNKARFIKGRSKSKIDIFFQRDLNLTICLPPKCGTTNWQNALASLSGDHGKGTIPRADPSDYGDAKRINSMSDIKIVNTRNPFQRLVSAWRDKFNVNIDARRQGFFLPSIKTFEEGYEHDEKYSCSFEAFVSYRAANPSEFCNNRHWRTVYWECSYCHFNYDMILHLEEVHNEYNYTWEKIAPIKPVMEDQYKTSPLAHTHPSEFWKDVPRDVAKKIYMIYFMDLAALGYDPEECLKYVFAGPEDKNVLSEDAINLARSKLSHSDVYKNQSFLNEICY